MLSRRYQTHREPYNIQKNYNYNIIDGEEHENDKQIRQIRI